MRIRVLAIGLFFLTYIVPVIGYFAKESPYFTSEYIPIYQYDFGINSDVIKTKAVKVKTDYMDGYFHLVYTIENKSNSALYLLTRIENAPYWKYLFNEGFIPNRKIDKEGYYVWNSYRGGWRKVKKAKNDEDKNLVRVLPLLTFNSREVGKNSIWWRSDIPHYKKYFFYEGKIQKVVYRYRSKMNENASGSFIDIVHDSSGALDLKVVKKIEAGSNIYKEFQYIDLESLSSEIVFLFSRKNTTDFNIDNIPENYLPLFKISNTGYRALWVSDLIKGNLDLFKKIPLSDFGEPGTIINHFNKTTVEQSSELWKSPPPAKQNYKMYYTLGGEILPFYINIEWVKNPYFIPFEDRFYNQKGHVVGAISKEKEKKNNQYLRLFVLLLAFTGLGFAIRFIFVNFIFPREN